jgi:hypothetical protein
MSQENVTREQALAFAEAYRRTWESWDFTGFVDLFSDDVVYVAHATQETVVGRAALASYIRKEAARSGSGERSHGKPACRLPPCRGRVLGYADQRGGQLDDRRVLHRAT